jgi:hypothetical protein
VEAARSGLGEARGSVLGVGEDRAHVDPVLWDVARIVHEADLADDRYDVPEASGLDVLLRGLSMVRNDDEAVVVASALFDGLYEYRRRALASGREPA